MGGERHAREVIALEKTDRAGPQSHIRRIHEYDVAALAGPVAPDKPDDLSRQVLGGGAAFKCRAPRPGARAGSHQLPGHENAGGIVRAEVGPDSENSDPVGLR